LFGEKADQSFAAGIRLIGCQDVAGISDQLKSRPRDAAGYGLAVLRWYEMVLIAMYN